MPAPTRTEIFKAYNRARAAAHAGRLEPGRVNRALGLTLRKGAWAHRPYQTTLTSCDCFDSRRGAICKHRIALMIQARAKQILEGTYDV